MAGCGGEHGVLTRSGARRRAGMGAVCCLRRAEQCAEQARNVPPISRLGVSSRAGLNEHKGKTRCVGCVGSVSPHLGGAGAGRGLQHLPLVLPHRLALSRWPGWPAKVRVERHRRHRIPCRQPARRRLPRARLRARFGSALAARRRTSASVQTRLAGQLQRDSAETMLPARAGRAPRRGSTPVGAARAACINCWEAYAEASRASLRDEMRAPASFAARPAARGLDAGGQPAWADR